MDPSQNVIGRRYDPLDSIFLPKTIAVIGAKDNSGSVGRTIFANLTTGEYKGRVYPVNPHRREVLGKVCYPSVKELPEKIDLAVIVTPAATVVEVVKECVEAGVKGAIIISAGFKERGEEGAAREREILAAANKKMRIIGPNCLGVMNPFIGLNATFARGMAKAGSIAFISQSGAMCSSVLDWSFQEKIGFSSFVSVGSMLDVSWGDLIDYLGEDPHTESLLIYMETIGDPRSFLSAAREIALEKPIIVIKPGRTEAAARAAMSHTGSLAGSDDVFNAALERAGVMRVDTMSELFSMASVLSGQPRPQGPRLAIVTNAGGPSVLATDSAILHGAEVRRLSRQTEAALSEFLPAAWSHNNPVDILGDSGVEEYVKSLDILSKDPDVDGLLVILSPQDITDPTAVAEALVPYAKIPNKPLLTSWMGGRSVEKGIEILSKAEIPTFAYADEAAQTFARLWNYSKNLASLYETPRECSDKPEKRAVAHLWLDEIHRQGRVLLNEAESKKLLSLYGIPVVVTEKADSLQKALHLASQIGYPVVLKLYSDTITHKTEVGGVKLNLKSSEDVKRAWEEIESKVEPFQGVTVQKMISNDGYELILGSTVDSQFGPIILFGTGGQLVEVYKDRALGLPPLNANLALRLMEKTKIFEALQGVRGRKAVNLAQLEDLLVRFSELIVHHPLIKECDINPLLVSESQMLALDARVVLHANTNEIKPLSIRPYPNQYQTEITLKNGLNVTCRPIRPEDEPLVAAFHKDLSEHSVRQRYFEFLSLDKRVAHERLVRICFNDFDRDIPLIAEVFHPRREILGIARLTRIRGTDEAKLTLLIRDAYHNLGLGTQLLTQLITIAKQESIHSIQAQILSENTVMLALCRRLGFSFTKNGLYEDIELRL